MKYLILFVIFLSLIALGTAHYIQRTPVVETMQTYPSVTFKTIEPLKIRTWSEFSGRLKAVDSAEIRPQVSGRITEVLFEDGELVRAGDILFIIDPRPYEAAVARAEAKIASAKANASYSKLEMNRAANMIKTQAVAQRIYDERLNTNEAADATLKSAEADLKQAKVDLEHAYVQAPISGRAGRVELTVGNLVQPGVTAPLMTRIVANDPIYVDFEVDEQTYIESVRNSAQNRKLERDIPVKLYILGNKQNSYQGTIYSFDNQLDVTTGTIRARAKFDNKDEVLLPGMFVTVALGKSEDEEVLRVPQQIINADQGKKYVFLIDKDNKAIYREVTLGKEFDNQRIILQGLLPGDRVIINGMQHIKAGQIVSPVEMAGE